MGVHTGAVVALDRLRHEGRGLAILLRHHLHDVFVNLHVVGGADQRVKDEAQFVLGRRHLVVVLFDFEAHLEHGRKHLAAQIRGAVHRTDREIAALDAGAVAGVAVRQLAVAVIGTFLAVDRVHLRFHRRFVAHVVEHEEFGLGTEIRLVADAGGGEIFLGLLGDRAWAAPVGLARQRLVGVAEQDDRGLRRERI